jgi:hypothetical protein
MIVSNHDFEQGRFPNPIFFSNLFLAFSVFKYGQVGDYKFESLASALNSWGVSASLLMHIVTPYASLLQDAAGSCSLPLPRPGKYCANHHGQEKDPLPPYWNR